MSDRTSLSATIHVANFLSSTLEPTYAHIAHSIGADIGYAAELYTGQTLAEFANGQADVGFLCGLQYVRMMDWPICPVELLAAPVLCAERYQGRPIYFSDVVVQRASPYTSFDDLGGCTWAYNERVSHSGCNLVCYSLLERGKGANYFGTTSKSGSHLHSLQMVLAGEADATAIDSHVLDMLLKTDAAIASQIRVIAMLGPSTIPPVVVARRLKPQLKRQLREALITLHQDAAGVAGLQSGLIERFVPVTDEDYQDIRRMFVRVEAVTFQFS